MSFSIETGCNATAAIPYRCGADGQSILYCQQNKTSKTDSWTTFGKCENTCFQLAESYPQCTQPTTGSTIAFAAPGNKVAQYTILERCPCKVLSDGNPHCMDKIGLVPIVFASVSPTATSTVDSTTQSDSWTDEESCFNQHRRLHATTTDMESDTDSATDFTTTDDMETSTTESPIPTIFPPSPVIFHTSIGSNCQSGCQEYGGSPQIDIGHGCDDSENGLYKCNTEHSFHCCLCVGSMDSDSCDCQNIGAYPYCMGPFTGTKPSPLTTTTDTPTPDPSPSDTLTDTETDSTTDAIAESENMSETESGTETDTLTESTEDCASETDIMMDGEGMFVPLKAASKTSSGLAAVDAAVATNSPDTESPLPIVSPVSMTVSSTINYNAEFAASESKRTSALSVRHYVYLILTMHVVLGVFPTLFGL
ncbi:hypothetical protein BDR26DRAFT_870557 [Obelidium mucronatum]|nr:hypothetical protein BDR26DRAFT_870557 [Obelidium mucronatum]